MNVDEFKEFAKATVDYIADYFDNIRDKNVVALVEPGYLEHHLPKTVPSSGENWKTILQDIDDLIAPGLSHWHSPRFHAYCPTANSFPGIVGEFLSSGLGIVAHDWESSPACTELEVRMMDWLAKLLGLPDFYLNSSKGPGGGVIQNAASESTLVGLLTGAAQSVQIQLRTNPDQSEQVIRSKLVAYTSEQSNSSVEKSGLLASIPMRLLSTDENGSLRGSTLEKAVLEDLRNGFIPCCAVATLGTTGTCGFDNLEELGLVCKKYDMWLHVDAAYAGSAFACPEYRYLMKGIEYTDSFNFNPHKWLLINSDCSAMWFRDTSIFQEAYKASKKLSSYGLELQHWQIPSTRRFRALKIWFVLRIYGVEGIRNHIRTQIGLAEKFAQFLRIDGRFEILTTVMGLVCFKLKGDNCLTQKLIEKISEEAKLFLTPYFFQAKFYIRFVICSRLTNLDDVKFSLHHITKHIDQVFKECNVKN